jgi:hypothetical protein
MPEIRLPDVRVPELRLPEMTRDDIARTLGDVREDLAEMGRDIDLSRIDIPRIDLPKAAAAAGLARSRRVSRLPIIVGALVTLGIVAWALLNSPSVKPRLQAAAQRARERMESQRAEAAEAHAFDAAVAAEPHANPWAEDIPAGGSPFDGSSDLPEGLGAAEPAEAPKLVTTPAGEESNPA